MPSESQSIRDGHLECINVAQHCMKLPSENAQQIHTVLYWAGPNAKEVEKVKIDKSVLQKVTKLAQTERVVPISFAPKNDKSIRFLVDRQYLNTVTKRDSYHIPRTEECIDSFYEAAEFFTLDANKGYLQFEAKKIDCGKTAITSYNWLYKSVRMSLRMENASATFRRAVNVILLPVRDMLNFMYLENNIVTSRSPHDHTGHVKQICHFYKIQGHPRVLKGSFLANTSDYLARIIPRQHLEIATQSMDAALELQQPTNSTELCSFLGLFNFFCSSVPILARIAAPLNNELMKDRPPHFDTSKAEELCAMHILQKKQVSSHRFPRYQIPETSTR